MKAKSSIIDMLSGPIGDQWQPLFANVIEDVESGLKQKFLGVGDIEENGWPQFFGAFFQMLLDELVTDHDSDFFITKLVENADKEMWERLIWLGIFIVPKSPLLVGTSLGDHPLDFLFNGLKAAIGKHRAHVKKILCLFLQGMHYANHIWGKEDLKKSKIYLRERMEIYGPGILEHLIAVGWFQEAKMFLRAYDFQRARFFIEIKEPFTKAHFISSPILEVILEGLWRCKEWCMKLQFDEQEGFYLEDVLEKILSTHFGQDPFSDEAEKILRLIETNFEPKDEEDHKLMGCLRHYYCIGKLRNYLFNMLAHGEAKKIILKSGKKSMVKFFLYINSPNEFLNELRKYGGLYYLFGLHEQGENNLFELALRQKNDLFVMLVMAALGQGYHYKNLAGQNAFHILFEIANKKGNFNQNDDFLFSTVRYLLYSGRLAKGILKDMLFEHDNMGYSPLDLAKEFGRIKCLGVMKNFLLENP